MFHRHPVLATRAGGVPEVVVDGETGHLEAVGDIAAFAARLDAIAADPERGRPMGERGCQRAQSLFSAGKITEEYLDCYRQALGDSQPDDSPSSAASQSSRADG